MCNVPIILRYLGEFVSGFFWGAPPSPHVKTRQRDSWRPVCGSEPRAGTTTWTDDVSRPCRFRSNSQLSMFGKPTWRRGVNHSVGVGGTEEPRRWRWFVDRGPRVASTPRGASTQRSRSTSGSEGKMAKLWATRSLVPQFCVIASTRS